MMACVCTRKLALLLLGGVCAKRTTAKSSPCLTAGKCSYRSRSLGWAFYRSRSLGWACSVARAGRSACGQLRGRWQRARLPFAHGEVDALQDFLAGGRHRRAQALHLQQHGARRAPQAATSPWRQTTAPVPVPKRVGRQTRALWACIERARGCGTSLSRDSCTATPCLPRVCSAVVHRRSRRPSCEVDGTGRRSALFG